MDPSNMSVVTCFTIYGKPSPVLSMDSLCRCFKIRMYRVSFKQLSKACVYSDTCTPFHTK